MIARMRGATGVDLQSAFEAEVGSTTGAAQYSAAADFLLRNLGRSALNAVVRDGVLSAYRGKIAKAADLLQIEQDVRCWELPEGCAALGALIAQIPAERRGAVLTTNFDPLLEISLERAGVRPEAIALENDGRINSVRSLATRVIHVHGYWRDSDTLHLVPQLGESRPQVEEHIRKILAGCDVFVLGYGGWDDVIMRTISSRVAVGGYDDIDVLWSMRGQLADEPGTSELPRLLEGRTNVVAYEGVDVNRVLPSALRRCGSTMAACSTGSRVRRPRPRVGVHAELLSEGQRAAMRAAVSQATPAIRLNDLYKTDLDRARQVTREFDA